MSGNINVIRNDISYSKLFAEDLKKAIKDPGNEEFSEAKKLWKKLGLKVAITEMDMINTVVETLSNNLTKGLLQLTVEEIIREKEVKGALREKKGQTIVMRLSKPLPPFKIYAEFIIKSGLVELKKFRFDFKVEPNIEIENINVTIQENKVKSVSFGSFKASVALSLLKGEQSMNIVFIEKSLNLSDMHFPFHEEFENRLVEAVRTDAVTKAELILPTRKMEITADEKTFGRSDFETDLSADDLGYISKNERGKYHFKITKQRGIFYIQDDHSKNGTKLNGEEIKGRGMKELKDDDTITLAGINNFVITFKISGG